MSLFSPIRLGAVEVPNRIVMPPMGRSRAGDAQRVVAEGQADLVAFGRAYIANPDLVERFNRDAPLNPPDPSTFYGGGPPGYVDYPTL